MRILIVEDEPVLGDAVRERLSRDGHAVDLVAQIEDARAALASVDYGLVLLDLHLPDGLGLDLLRGMRRARDQRPVVILTARDQIRDRIDGLNAGADDYLVKPFDLDELSARVAAVARRYTGNPNPGLELAGEVVVDRARRSVRKAGNDVLLTAREWAVLDNLADRPGSTVGKDRLEEALYAFGSEIESNTVEVYISRLRKKLGAKCIVTVRGVGYKLGDDG